MNPKKAKRYVAAVVVAMLEHELNEARRNEGWMFGGLPLRDVPRVVAAIKALIAELHRADEGPSDCP